MIDWQKKYGHIVLKEIPDSQQYMLGKENNEADYMPRLLNDNTEWKLDPQFFQKY